MKTTFKFIASLITIFVVSSCEDYFNDIQDPQGPITVQFSQSQVTLVENAGTNEISLIFDKPAASTSMIAIAVSSTQMSAFTTDPAHVDGQIQLPVTTGQSLLKFKVNPINNSVMDGDKSISFSLAQLLDGYKKGQKDRADILIVDDEGPVIANFVSNNTSIQETNTAGMNILIVFSALTPGNGVVDIEINSETAHYGEDFITDPAAIEGRFNLYIPAGTASATFKIIPINNSVLSGNKQLVFKMIATQGAVQRGAMTGHIIDIVDDENVFKPKSYKILNGNEWIKRTYEYNADGTIAKINWETQIPSYKGTDTYYYNSTGQLQRINEYTGSDIHYFWENDRIVKSEIVKNKQLKQYNKYYYDDLGNVSGTAFYYVQPSGEFKLGLTIGYLYFIDGNLYKSIKSIPNENNEFTVISTQTYDGYVNGFNPFPMANILPTLNSQQKLVTYYRVEENGFDFVYQISYEFREDGWPTKRIATSNIVSQTTLYDYY